MGVLEKMTSRSDECARNICLNGGQCRSEVTVTNRINKW